MIFYLIFLRLIIILANRRILGYHIKRTCVRNFLDKFNQIFVSCLIEANLRKSKFRGLIYLHSPLFRTERNLAEEPSKGRVQPYLPSYLLATACEDRLYPSRRWPFALAAALTFRSGICESDRLQISDAIEDIEMPGWCESRTVVFGEKLLCGLDARLLEHAMILPLWSCTSALSLLHFLLIFACLRIAFYAASGESLDPRLSGDVYRHIRRDYHVANYKATNNERHIARFAIWIIFRLSFASLLMYE